MAELEITLKDGTSRRHALGDTPVSIGRIADNHVVLADEPKASRKHCRVEKQGGGWRVVDEGSANGTFLAGSPVIVSRLSPGDEIEIGDTLLKFHDESGEPEPPPLPRRPRVRRRETPWGVLAIPLVALGIAVGLVIHLGKSDGAESAASMTRYAKAEIERASFEKDAGKRISMLFAAREVAAAHIHGEDAVRLLDAARGAPPASPDEPGATPKKKDEWRDAIDAYDADKTASSSLRRSTLAELLDRHAADTSAVTLLRDRIRTELTSAGERIREDREKTFADADQAYVDGRYGDALELWTSWIARAPALSADDDRGVAQRLSETINGARTAAETAATQYNATRSAGNRENAQAALDAVVARLHGTGFDVWLAARGGTPISRQPGKSPTPDVTEDQSVKERTRALQLLANGEKLTRERRFAEAVTKIEEAAAAVSDATLKSQIAQRAADLQAEAEFFAKLVAIVAAEPAKFTQLKDRDKLIRVASATPDSITFALANGQTDTQPLSAVSSALVAQFVERAAIGPADYVPAALLLNDLDEKDAFLRWIRAALPEDDHLIRAATSDVYARVTGKPVPVGGYRQHPRDGRSVVTSDERTRILNEEKIAELSAELVKSVEKIEKSKQAKSIEHVREAYAKLETARANALKLINDTVTYFYPYRDRMREYQPVQKQVDDLVKIVREAWEDPTSAKIRTDAAMEKAKTDAEKLVGQIEDLKGDASVFEERIDAVVRYLGHDITVQTFFENQMDLDRMAYNARVLKWNTTVKGPTEPEKKQVLVTNEYRIMFGHRACVRVHPQLVESARGHSTDMSNLGFFDHASPVPGKESFDLRIKLAGYTPVGCSENIAAGGSDPESAHERWCHSSGHHRNLLDPSWRELGSGQFGGYWTQNFAFRSEDGWEGGEWPTVK